MESGINYLENSNRILRRELLLGNNKQTAVDNKTIHESCIPTEPNEGHALKSQILITPPQSGMEQELMNLKENLRNVELEHLKMKSPEYGNACVDVLSQRQMTG